MEVTAEVTAEFMSSDDVVFMGHFVADDTSGYERYQSLAKYYHDRYSFGIIPSPAKEQSSIQCKNNLDAEEHILTELWRVEAFENFVRMCSERMIPEITRTNEMNYYAPVSLDCTKMLFSNSDVVLTLSTGRQASSALPHEK